MPLSETNKAIWIWLLHNEGVWRSSFIAKELGLDSKKVSSGLLSMAIGGTVIKYKSKLCKENSYGVDGTCLVPKGLRIGEVQL